MSFELSPAPDICRPLRGLISWGGHLVLGLTPQANHFSPLRGSDGRCL